MGFPCRWCKSRKQQYQICQVLGLNLVIWTKDCSKISRCSQTRLAQCEGMLLSFRFTSLCLKTTILLTTFLLGTKP